ncbi:MAG: hybrid sensor histidine kinase/response regulator [Verrucomicrobiaceae bacterium]|nr:MAG: hybrid sensor histidine kinase/response regulator [Verrucomicrobiaceae bacterium]
MTDTSSQTLQEQKEKLFAAQQETVCRNTDRIFKWLLLLQWLVGIVLTLHVSPLTWAGESSKVHPHVWASLVLGGIISVFPALLAWKQPGRQFTRHVVAVGQMLMGALLIHLTGGRIETHFHVFGSLAFLAFYRDWKVLITATAVVLADHLLRGSFWPQSIYGTVSQSLWRTAEHAGWVIFENVFLLLSIRQSLREMRRQAGQQAELERINAGVEEQVRRRTADLAFSEEKFRVMSTSAPVGIFQTNAKGECTYVNDRWREITRRQDMENPAQLVGYLHPDDRRQVLKAWRAVMEQGVPFDCECRLLPLILHDEDEMEAGEGGNGALRANGVRWLHICANALRARNRITGTVGTITDVTQRRNTENELALARDAAMESARLKSEFLANMSHEIRTPMNAVIGLSNLVLDTELTDQQRDFITTVCHSAESLLTILNDILDFSKIESGKLLFEEEDFSLRHAMEDTLELMAERAHLKRLELVGLVQPNTPVQLRGDSGRLRQVLINLLSNAVKFTESGEVVMSVALVSRNADTVKLRFEVRDTGIGISPEVEERLFSAFSQGDGSTTRKYGGTGLGLVISKRIVELMGGDIGLQSEPGQGTLFWFTAVFKHSQAPLELTPHLPGSNTPTGVKALIVDDNLTNIMVLHHQLAAWGMTSRHASSADEAMRLMEQETAAGKPFQIILLDMQMPERTGLDLAREIKAHPAFSGTPAIMLTSLGMRMEPNVLREAGILECLLKPVRQSRLYDCLLKHLPARRHSAVLENVPVRSPAPAPASALSTAALRILVAEDNLVNQKVIVLQLKKLGWTAQVAANGYEVLDAMDRSRFDLILMDCQMPEMEGYEATRRIRDRERVRGVPEADRVHIVALTANAMAGDRERCMAVGMNDYLSKPVKHDMLAAAIRRFVDSRPQPAGETAAVP